LTAGNQQAVIAAMEIKRLRDRAGQAPKGISRRTGSRSAAGRAGTSFQMRPATNEAPAKPRQTRNTREV
jgi:hypothetical protein